MDYSVEKLQRFIGDRLRENFSVSAESASDMQYYKATALVVKDILEQKRRLFMSRSRSEGRKQVYYLCMEFLLGRSLKNSIYNLCLADTFKEALGKMGVKLENLYEYEPDAGLGNGGLGRLAACYMDALATTGYPAMGYCILYEYGIFRQQIVDGWQNELPDYWLPGGEVWLTSMPDHAVEVRFGGTIKENWDNDYHSIQHVGYTSVMAIPYDINISGYNSDAVSRLRLWKAKSTGFNMELFNQGEYSSASGDTLISEAISKVLYPNDNHREGKILRLKQQYFLTAASVADIVRRHMDIYGTLDNFPEKNALHLNDTHPILAIPELMRMLLDECGYSWEHAFRMVCATFTYTNHTVMPEALECWAEDLFKPLLPRIYQIISEINRRYCQSLYESYSLDDMTVGRMAVIGSRTIRMANLAVAVCNKVNGVSKLHSDILKEDVFNDFYTVQPQKFTNVTNGIASRRWLHQSNPELSSLLSELLGEDYLDDLSSLSGLKVFKNNATVLKQLHDIKKNNKQRMSDYLVKTTGCRPIDPDSIFDVQVKRLHEYKRQHLNALKILTLYRYLKENPNADFIPQTFIFGAKAAPGYFLAKQIIKFICSLRDMIEADEAVRDKIRIVYLEDYRVTVSEILMPASEVSEQISLAGTEASGTSNMKLMLGGAITFGTMDGANVEIFEAVGEDNIVIFGMTTPEVNSLRERGYNPVGIYRQNHQLSAAVEMLKTGINGNTFDDIYRSLTQSDPYMVLADFDSYYNQAWHIQELYHKTKVWQKMSLLNIAGSGIFCADRSIRDYAKGIWKL